MKTTSFKPSEIGPIPDDWNVKALGEIGSDYAYGVSAEAITFNGKDKYIRITDIDEDSRQYNPMPLVSPAFYSDNHIVKENDLLIARTGASVGKTYLYDNKDGKLIFAGFLMKTNISKAFAKYVFYQTNSANYKNWVLQESARSGQPGLNIAQIKSFLLPLPPLPEQRRIASALTSVDSLLKSLDALIDKKRCIKQGAMHNLLSGKTRLLNFNEKCTRKRLGEVCEIKRGVRVTRESLSAHYKYPVFQNTNYPLGFFNKYNVEANTPFVIVGGSAGLVGCCNVNYWAADDCAYFTRFNNLDKTFLYFELVYRQSEIKSAVRSSSVPRLDRKEVENLEILLPPSLSEQRAISKILSGMDAEIAALEAKRQKYQAVKQGMMQALLSGKVRI